MKYHKSSQSIIKAAYSHDIAQKPFQTLGTQCPHYGQQMPNTWAIGKRLRVYTLHNSKKAVTAD